MQKLTIALCLVVILTGMLPLRAQQPGKKAAMEVMQKLSGVYRRSAALSFDVVYKIASEETPSVYLDSMYGQFKLSGPRYWYRLDNTESVHTGDYVIMLFKEDNIMYLARPAGATATNPLAMLDSALLYNNHINCRLEDSGQQQIVLMDFSGQSIYKRIEYYIDKGSGLLTKMVSIVSAGQLYDASVRDKLEGAPSYAIVEAVFNNYSRSGIDDSLFNGSRYFSKQGSEYVTVAPFENYKIFLGSPGL